MYFLWLFGQFIFCRDGVDEAGLRVVHRHYYRQDGPQLVGGQRMREHLSTPYVRESEIESKVGNWRTISCYTGIVFLVSALPWSLTLNQSGRLPVNGGWIP